MPDSKTLHILLADDDTDDCIFFQETLEELDIPNQLDTVHDGEQLMRFLLHETTALPDILFLDLNMPRKNGFECLLEIKLSEKLKIIPVIVYSTSFEQEMVNMLYANGAHFFMRKPSEFSKFKRIIQQCLGLVKFGISAQPSKENFVLTVHGD